METVDLTGGEVKVVANKGDIHEFRLSNPDNQVLIVAGETYEGEFTANLGQKTAVAIDTSAAATGTLIFSLTMLSGVFRLKNLTSKRTILIMEVEVR